MKNNNIQGNTMMNEMSVVLAFLTLIEQKLKSDPTIGDSVRAIMHEVVDIFFRDETIIDHITLLNSTLAPMIATMAVMQNAAETWGMKMEESSELLDKNKAFITALKVFKAKFQKIKNEASIHSKPAMMKAKKQSKV